MKLIIQIPCLDEAATLPQTLADLPRTVPGFDRVEILVIDDGSSDGTARVAAEHGVDHVLRHPGNRGLARAFQTGLDACLARGADVIVNTDADNQYAAEDLAELLRPILAGEADIVLGERDLGQLPRYSWWKRQAHGLGTGVMGRLTGLSIRDPVSGFRALTREAATELTIVSDFSYTLEMLIQAGKKQLRVATVPVRVNAPTRPSRLFGSARVFLQRSATTILRVWTMYSPLKILLTIGGGLALVGLLPIARFLYFYVTSDGTGHVQSLVLGSALLVGGLLTILAGLLADLIAFNRRLLEMNLKLTRRLSAQLAERPEPKPGSVDDP